MEERESECIHKSINKEKDANNETENEEPLGTYNPVVKDPREFNIFECGKNILNRLYVTCERAYMANSRNKYYTEMLRTITDYNECNDAPL